MFEDQAKLYELSFGTRSSARSVVIKLDFESIGWMEVEEGAMLLGTVLV